MNLIIIFALFVSGIYANYSFTEIEPSLRCSLPYGTTDEPSERGFNCMEKPIEVWKDVVGFEGIYQISNYGKVNRIARVSNGRNLRCVPMFLSIGRGGYFTVKLWKGGKAICWTIHRLVATAFIQNPLNKSQVNHIDGNKLNNCEWNLEWVTPSENIIHAVSTGLRTNTIGEKNAAAKITTQQVFLIRDDKRKASEVAADYNLHVGQIYRIKSKRSWKHL